MKGFYIVIFLLFFENAFTQQTGGNLTGYVTNNGNPVENALIILSTQSKKEKYNTYSTQKGYYQFNNIHAEEGYQVLAISSTHDSVYANNIEILLGETIQLNLVFDKKINQLQDVLVKSSIPQKFYSFTVKTTTDLASANGIYGGLFQQFPNLQILQNGGLSIAQQNPRLNAVYIDGALQNDIFGLGATGVAGAQTLGFPIQKEEVEQVQVMSSSFDVAIGNNTGGAIHITTKAGSNKAKQKYFLENSWGNIAQQKMGLQLSGPIIQNKLFYAISFDRLYFNASQPFNFSTYKGDIQTDKQWELAANTIQHLYNYDIGNVNFIDNRENRKLSARIDWLLPKNQKIVCSFRTFQYARINTNRSTHTSIHFSNGAKHFTGAVTYGNIEYKKWWRKSSNRLLLSAYNNTDISKTGNAAFPSLRILDGDGFMYAGNQPDAMQNELNQKQLFVYNRFQIEKNNSTISVGTEIHYSTIKNSFLPNNYGTYFYYSLSDFLQNKRPGAYERNIYTQSTNPIKYIRAAIFFQTEKKIHKNFHIQAGVRIGFEQVKMREQANDSFNNQLLPTMLAMHNESATAAGVQAIIPPAVNPRISFTYQATNKGWWIHGGTGFFTSTVPLAWLSGISLFNGLNTETFNASATTLKQLRFNPDPLTQWHPAQFGDSFSNTPINLVSSHLKMPTVWKTSIQVKKIINRSFMLQTELLFFSNQQEISFKNIALPIPNSRLVGADTRTVYDSNANIAGFNQVYLLKNADQASGYGYQVNIQLRKKIKHATIDLAYVLGDVFSLHDGNYNLLANQWKLNESDEGRNTLKRSRSDYSIGSAAQVRYNHSIILGKKQIGLQIEYIGSAGNLVSYVYGEKSLVRDDEKSPGFDLIYIPTITDLQQQQFVPFISEGLYYPVNLQKELLNQFIEADKYLSSRRGLYAERNGSRQPFRHQINASFNCNFPFQLYRNKVWLNFYIHLFNLQNWLLPTTKVANLSFASKVRPINFMGYVPGSFVPTYSFNPGILAINTQQLPLGASLETDRFFLLKTGISLSFY
jgi:hypothetical protein